MTESQWLKSDDAEKMNQFYGKRYTERKARLLMLASCLRHPAELQDDSIRVVVDLLIAHYADTRKLNAQFRGVKLNALYRELDRYASATESVLGRGVAFGMVAAAEPVSRMKRLGEDFRYLVFSCLHDVAHGVAEGGSKQESKVQAALVREVLGNPFRPVAFDPAWLTETVLLLARQMYESQNFSAMPILSDALQDAGCANADMLRHCQDAEQIHVRGCWVLDLILHGAMALELKARRKRKQKEQA